MLGLRRDVCAMLSEVPPEVSLGRGTGRVLDNGAQVTVYSVLGRDLIRIETVRPHPTDDGAQLALGFFLTHEGADTLRELIGAVLCRECPPAEPAPHRDSPDQALLAAYRGLWSRIPAGLRNRMEHALLCWAPVPIEDAYRREMAEREESPDWRPTLGEDIADPG